MIPLTPPWRKASDALENSYPRYFRSSLSRLIRPYTRGKYFLKNLDCTLMWWGRYIPSFTAETKQSLEDRTLWRPMVRVSSPRIILYELHSILVLNWICNDFCFKQILLNCIHIDTRSFHNKDKVTWPCLYSCC